MSQDQAIYSAPTWRLTRWLAEPPAGTSAAIRSELIGSLFGTLPIFLGGIFNTILVAAVSAARQPSWPFLIWLGMEVALCLTRLAVLVHALKAARTGRPTPTDLYLVLAVMWGASVGFGCFIGLTSGDWVIATLCCLSAAAMVGGICFRNFGAPRLASVMIALSLGPTCPGALMTGEPIMLAVFLQIPFYLFSMSVAAFRLNRMLVSTMTAEQESGHRARHDDLTGLANRSNLMRAMDGRLQRGREAPFALLYLDLDGFKAVNDTHGHAAGDKVLQIVAERLKAATCADDMAARLGGDEFVVLLDGMSAEHAPVFAERLIGRIAGLYPIGDGIEAEIGVSIGIAAAPRHGRDGRTLLAAADAALYAAKALGRRRCALAADGPPALEAAPSIVPEPAPGAAARQDQSQAH